jgi:putative membrane protein
LGFCVALAGAIANSETYIDFLIWAAIALLAQLLAFAALRFTFMPKIAERIENAEMSAGTMLASVSVGVGLLNAACMTY